MKLISVVVILALSASLSGCIGFHYLEVVDNQPLANPVRVREVRSSDLLELEDGRRVRLAKGIPDLEAWIERSERQVEVVPKAVSSDGVILADVYVKQRLGYCGSPWANMITIRLIPDRYDRWIRSKLEPCLSE